MKTIKLLMIKLLNEWKFIYWTKVGFKNNGPNGLKLFFQQENTTYGIQTEGVAVCTVDLVRSLVAEQSDP